MTEAESWADMGRPVDETKELLRPVPPSDDKEVMAAVDDDA